MTKSMNIEIEKPKENGKSYEFQCKFCHYNTGRAILISLHMKDTHGQDYIFRCDKCNYPPTTRRSKFLSHVCDPDIHGYYDRDKPSNFPKSSTVVHQSNVSIPSRASSQTVTPPASNDLCLICGGHHGPQCNFTFESKCDRCGKDGHVESLHSIGSYEDYRIIKSFMPDLQLSFNLPNH